VARIPGDRRGRGLSDALWCGGLSNAATGRSPACAVRSRRPARPRGVLLGDIHPRPRDWSPGLARGRPSTSSSIWRKRAHSTADPAALAPEAGGSGSARPRLAARAGARRFCLSQLESSRWGMANRGPAGPFPAPADEPRPESPMATASSRRRRALGRGRRALTGIEPRHHPPPPRSSYGPGVRANFEALLSPRRRAVRPLPFAALDKTAAAFLHADNLTDSDRGRHAGIPAGTRNRSCSASDGVDLSTPAR